MKKTIYRVIYLPIYALIYVFSLVPLKILYFISEFLYFLMYYVIGYRRSIVIQNLSRAFPERQYGEIKDLCKQFYRSFAQWLAEIIKLFSVPLPELKQQVELINFDFVKRCLDENRNVVAGMGHFGNWEMLSILPQLLDADVVSVYKPMRNKIVDRILHKVRSRFGMRMVASHQVVRQMLTGGKGSSLYLFVADQCPPHSDTSGLVKFLNQPTRILPGIERLSKATDAAVVYLFMKRTRRGYYSIECIPICEHPKQAAEISITDSYRELLEYNVRATPDNWLWTHKRWKR
jgi:Kdo2-lipid IVA lauroyltransferase/acyltransferase